MAPGETDPAGNTGHPEGSRFSQKNRGVGRREETQKQTNKKRRRKKDDSGDKNFLFTLLLTLGWVLHASEEEPGGVCNVGLGLGLGGVCHGRGPIHVMGPHYRMGTYTST